MTLSVFVVDSDFIVEDGMEAHILEVSNLLHIAKIVAITLPQAQDGAPGTEHLLPEVRERMAGGGGVDDDNPEVLRTIPHLSRSLRPYQRHRKSGEKDKSLRD